MIELIGTRSEIAEAVKCIAPTYPVDLIGHLEKGDWFFVLNGVDVKVEITG